MELLKHFHIQKFDGKNFLLWKYQLEIIFRSEAGMFEIVNGSTPRPTIAAERAKWDAINAKAMLLISSGMEYEQLQTVLNCKNAPEMWNRLKTIHEQTSAVNKLQLMQQFFNYKMSETDTIAQHISKIDTLAQALNNVEEPIGDIDKIAKALGSLPIKYNGFVTAWDSYDETKQTYDNLTARLLKEEQRLTQSEEMTTAFAAIKLNKFTKSKSVSKPTGNDTEGKHIDKRNAECFYCKKKGHYKAECRKRQAKLKSHDDNKSQKERALVVEYNNLKVNSDQDDWLGDSAASKHMSYRRE